MPGFFCGMLARWFPRARYLTDAINRARIAPIQFVTMMTETSTRAIHFSELSVRARQHGAAQKSTLESLTKQVKPAPHRYRE